MPPDYPLKWNAVTHPGLKRSNNEDCFLGSPNTGLWLVADGMGGHEAGEVASAVVRDTLEKLAQQPETFSLTDAIQSAHLAILAAAERGIGVIGMGSTLVALFNQPKHYQIAWVGDSRAYLWAQNAGPATEGSAASGELLRLTRDHSYVQMLFASGSITAEEIESHPDKHIITQCLGIQELPLLNVDSVQRQWQANQWVLLCSDGLTDELSDAAIASILTANNNSLTAVEQLLAAALEQGGRDNITVQIIESPIDSQAAAFGPPNNKLQLLLHTRTKLLIALATVALIALVLVGVTL